MPPHAIPTLYAGTQFRSRLEARWAAFFDLRGWRWTYEPLDLDGYIPDFVVHVGARAYLVEVKPAITFDTLLPVVSRVLSGGWRGHTALCGADGRAIVGSCTGGVWQESFRAVASCSEEWRTAGNRVQWKAPTP